MRHVTNYLQSVYADNKTKQFISYLENNMSLPSELFSNSIGNLEFEYFPMETYLIDDETSYFKLKTTLSLINQDQSHLRFNYKHFLDEIWYAYGRPRFKTLVSNGIASRVC